MRRILFFLIFGSITITASSQNVDPLKKLDDYGQRTWVDSIMKTMTVEEKIGQLFMIPAYSNRDITHIKKVESVIKKYKVGGIIFFQGTPDKQVKMTNGFQRVSKIPLMVGFDGEWGLNMRLNNTYRFPWNMTL